MLTLIRIHLTLILILILTPNSNPYLYPKSGPHPVHTSTLSRQLEVGDLVLLLICPLYTLILNRIF